jgi:hypothetical protein
VAERLRQLVERDRDLEHGQVRAGEKPSCRSEKASDPHGSCSSAPRATARACERRLPSLTRCSHWNAAEIGGSGRRRNVLGRRPAAGSPTLSSAGPPRLRGARPEARARRGPTSSNSPSTQTDRCVRGAAKDGRRERSCLPIDLTTQPPRSTAPGRQARAAVPRPDPC